MSVVPLRGLAVDHGEHPVLGRPAAPEGHDEGFLGPHVGPVAVVGLAHDIDVDAGGGHLLLEQHRGVDGAGERGIGGREVDLEGLEAGLPEVGDQPLHQLAFVIDDQDSLWHHVAPKTRAENREPNKEQSLP